MALVYSRMIVTLLSEISCPRCGSDAETVEHAVFECPPVNHIWRSVFSWWGNPSVASSIDEVFGWFDVRLPDKYIPVATSVLATIWSVWDCRNKLVFEGRSMDPVLVFGGVQQLSFFWLKHRWKSKAVLLWDGWCSNPSATFKVIYSYIKERA